MAGPGSDVMAGAGDEAAPAGRGLAGRPRGLAGAIWALEHAQDYVAAVVGIMLIVLAVVVVVSGLVDFAHTLARQMTAATVLAASVKLLDEILLVLILAEIVHTVVLSLRAHRLVAQPFIVVGLVAVIRKVLFVLSTSGPVPTSELALLIGMVVAFVAALIAVSRFERRDD